MENELFNRDVQVARILEDEQDDALFRRGTKVARIDPESLISSSSDRLENQILENAKGPKRVAGDAGSVEQHSLKDQIEAQRFLQSQKAVQGKGFPLRFHKIKADGTV